MSCAAAFRPLASGDLFKRLKYFDRVSPEVLILLTCPTSLWGRIISFNKISRPNSWASREKTMSETIHPVTPEWAKRAYVEEAKYNELYARSIKDPNGFWGEAAKTLDWNKPFSKVENTSFEPGKVSIKMFEDGVLNSAYNCIDRHLETLGVQTAIIWEGDDPSESRHITYRELHDEVCLMVNILWLC